MGTPLIGQLLKRSIKTLRPAGIYPGLIGAVIMMACASEPVPEQIQALKALPEMSISATTQDSVTFMIEGITDNEQFGSALAHLTILNKHYKLDLDLSGSSFTNLAGLAPLSSLQSLDLSGNTGIVDFTALPPLPNLETLKLSGMKSLQDFRAILKTPVLESLNLSNNSSLKDISGLLNLSSLKTLNLSGNSSIEDYRFASFSNVKDLEYLNLSANNLSDLTGFPSFSHLKSLDLSYNNVTRLNGLANLISLESLDLSYNNSMSNFKILTDLPNLKTINFYNSNITQSAVAMLQKTRTGLTIEK